MNKIQDKYINIIRTKRAFKIKQKVLLIIFNSLLLKQIRPAFMEGNSTDLKHTEGQFCTCKYILKHYRDNKLNSNNFMISEQSEISVTSAVIKN